MRYPRSCPESNHLLTVRGATLQILATSPVVRISFWRGICFFLLWLEGQSDCDPIWERIAGSPLLSSRATCTEGVQERPVALFCWREMKVTSPRGTCF